MVSLTPLSSLSPLSSPDLSVPAHLVHHRSLPCLSSLPLVPFLSLSLSPFFLELVRWIFHQTAVGGDSWCQQWCVCVLGLCFASAGLCAWLKEPREKLGRQNKTCKDREGKQNQHKLVLQNYFFFFALRDKQQQHSMCTMELRRHLDVLAGKFTLSGQRVKEIGYPDSHHVLVAGLMAACLSLVPD